MLTPAQIEDNKNRYCELLRSVVRDGFNAESLISMLCTSDFFYAPATAIGHGNFEGGLCDHCLKVYDRMSAMNAVFLGGSLDSNSIIIVSLCHDFSTIGKYKKSTKNFKKYCTDEEFEASPKDYKLFDELGNFKWVTVPCYVLNDDVNRFIYGSSEVTSEYITRCFIPLKTEESLSIIHHYGGLSDDSLKGEDDKVFRRCPLAFILFISEYYSSVLEEDVKQ